MYRFPAPQIASMASTAAAAFSFKNFGNNGVPTTRDVGIATSLRKKIDDATFTFSFTDASVKEPKVGKGVVLSVEKPLAEGVKANLSYDVGARNTIAAVTVNRAINGSDVQLRGIYRRNGDVFILEEQWKVDKNTRVNGSYNFASEEAVASVTHTNGPWTGHLAYNFARDAPLISLHRNSGFDTFGAVYAPREDAATLTWARKPFKASVRATKASARPAWSNLSASFVATHEFDL